jgi:hypothetical protein
MESSITTSPKRQLACELLPTFRRHAHVHAIICSTSEWRARVRVVVALRMVFSRMGCPSLPVVMNVRHPCGRGKNAISDA